jgi:hypothetical protein
MKDLILVTAYCPDEFRENTLRNCINSLSKFSQKYDIMIVSHTVIPIDIQKKVNYCFYDSKNEILTDWDLLNQPWFNPNNDRRIQSSFLSKKNTHLAIWRMMILGFSLSKNMGYKKVHHIEYDCNITNSLEFDENSTLLDDYDSVIYIDNNDKNVDEILLGSFQSYFIPTLSKFLINLDEEKIKEMIRVSSSKSPELMLQNILEEGGKVFRKNRNVLEKNRNYFGIIDGQVSSKFIPWAVPFYDRLEDTIGFVVWNTKNKNGVRHTIIINNEKVIQIQETLLEHWRMVNLGKFNDITHILVIENDEIRDKFLLTTDEEKKLFKLSSFRHKEPFNI